jgi:hypothetical protein
MGFAWALHQGAGAMSVSGTCNLKDRRAGFCAWFHFSRTPYQQKSLPKGVAMVTRTRIKAVKSKIDALLLAGRKEHLGAKRQNDLMTLIAERKRLVRRRNKQLKEKSDASST